MVKIYVASHCRWAALHVAEVLNRQGHSITSRWHYKAFNPTASHTEAERYEIAQEDYDDVASADYLVLIAGSERYPGGKFVETGIALGLGKKVIVIGRRENMLIWLPKIVQVQTPEEAAHLIFKIEACESGALDKS